MTCRFAKIRESSGQSVVELALVLPLLVLLFMGIFDVSRAIHAHNAIVNMTREGVNLASRSMLMLDKSKGPQLVMNSLANTERQLDMKHKGMMHITKIENLTGSASISEQYHWNLNPSGPASSVSAMTLGNVLGRITVKPGDTLWIFEVFYDYDSLFVPQSASVAVRHLHSLAIL